VIHRVSWNAQFWRTLVSLGARRNEDPNNGEMAVSWHPVDKNARGTLNWRQAAKPFDAAPFHLTVYPLRGKKKDGMIWVEGINPRDRSFDHPFTAQASANAIIEENGGPSAADEMLRVSIYRNNSGSPKAAWNTRDLPGQWNRQLDPDAEP